MNKPRTIEGQWWIHGDDKPAHFGILSFDPEGGLKLTVKIPQSRMCDAAWLSVFKEFGKTEKVLNVIHGTDENNCSVTLFGCGSWETSASAGLDIYRLGNIQAGILNFRGNSWNEARFQVARANYTLLTRWMNRRLDLESKVDDGGVCLKYKSREQLEFDLGPRVRLRIEGTTLRCRDKNELRLGWIHCAWFLFSESLPAKTIHDDYAQVLLRLLGLLTGERVFIEEFAFFDRDPFEPGAGAAPQESELVIANCGITEAKRDTPATDMVASFDDIAPDFGSILKRWFECHDKLEPVLDLYFAVFSNRVSTIESRFLLLAQALEVYHARSAFSSTELPTEEHKTKLKAIIEIVPAEYQTWLGDKLAFSNQKTLAKRLEEILNLHRVETAFLTAGVEDFAAKVRHTRNYYTHYSEESRRKAAKGLELRRIMFALEDLLRICLLKELGIQGKPVERILERNSSVTYADREPDTTN